MVRKLRLKWGRQVAIYSPGGATPRDRFRGFVYRLISRVNPGPDVAWTAPVATSGRQAYHPALLAVFVLVLAFPAFAAVETTTITGTIYLPGGATPVTQGTITATLSTSGTATDGASTSVVAGRISATIAANGSVSIVLVPNDAISPTNTYYTVSFVARAPTAVSWTEKWSVTTSPDPVAIGAVTRLNTPPGITAWLSTVQDEGTNLTQRAKLNFTGAGVSCADNSTSGRTDCTIGGGSLALDDLTDATISSPSTGQAVIYNGSAWTNGTPASASALDSNGANCSAYNAPLGVSAAGAAEGCWTPARKPIAGGRRMVWTIPASASGSTYTGVGMAAPSSLGTVASGIISGQPRGYVKHTGAASSNALAGLRESSTDLIRSKWQPIIAAGIYTDAAVSNRRVWLASSGFNSGNLMTLVAHATATTSLSTAYIGMGFDTSVNANWLCCSGDGTNHICTSTGVAVAANTAYDLILDWTVDGTLTCSVNGTSVSKSSNVKAHSTGDTYYHQLTNTTLDSTAQVLYISGFYIEQN